MTRQTDKKTDRLLENHYTPVEIDFVKFWVEFKGHILDAYLHMHKNISTGIIRERWRQETDIQEPRPFQEFIEQYTFWFICAL